MSEQIPDADGNDDLDGDDDDDDDGGDDDDGDCNVQGWPFIDHCLTSLFLGCATRIISIAPGLIILIGTMIIEDDDDDNDDDYDDGYDGDDDDGDDCDNSLIVVLFHTSPNSF